MLDLCYHDGDIVMRLCLADIGGYFRFEVIQHGGGAGGRSAEDGLLQALKAEHFRRGVSRLD
jgi:hypothetical protein